MCVGGGGGRGDGGYLWVNGAGRRTKELMLCKTDVPSHTLRPEGGSSETLFLLSHSNKFVMNGTPALGATSNFLSFVPE